MMVASLVFPAILFVFASWINYRNVVAVADERIERSLDVLHEQTLKVFQTAERSIAEVDAVLTGLDDTAIQANEERLHRRLRAISEALEQVASVAVMDRSGRPLVSSRLYPIPPTSNIADRDYFRAHISNNASTFVSEALVPRAGGGEGLIFNLSKRRPAADGSFNGVYTVAMVPGYFEKFYARIGRSPGSYYSMLRDDGVFLARYPTQGPAPRNLDPRSMLRQAIARKEDSGFFVVTPPASQVDGIERRIGFRKITGFPVYVQAGFETSAIRAEWLSTITSHLVFGLPATVLLFLILGITLQRTRRLHIEAERREAAEVALRQSQRLEAIGQLTGGVAHDFNNLLMVVNGSVERLRRELTEEKQVRLLDMIMTASRRGESLTRQLLSFSRQQTLTPTVIDLNRRLPEIEDMLRRSLRGDIEIKAMVPAATCAVKVDPSELELALLNIAVNARDAMPNGGALTIAAKAVTLKGHAGEEGLAGEFVAIRMADTGDGIPADMLPRVFEPFFTTKDVGKGTGLGLSQVYGFAKQSGGTATASSVAGKGTVITLYLPRTHERAETDRPVAEERQASPAGTVLLVEDNVDVADACTAYLTRLGYRVKMATGARAALDLLASGETVDLVFSDILMPGGMNGVELARTIRAKYPRLPILLTTGYSASAQDAVRQNFIVVQKPYEIETLKKSLEEARAAFEQPEPPRRAAG